MRKLKKKSLKTSNGITLIALVITIIVLLILAGITISLVLNNNGIIHRAKDASDTNMEALIREELTMAWSGVEIDRQAYGWDINQMATKLSQDLPEGNVSVAGTIVKVSNYKGYNADINSETGIVVISKGETIDFEAIKVNAKANRQGYEAIGIGTDGSIVDMSLWYYEPNGSKEEISSNGTLRLGGPQLGSNRGPMLGYKESIVNGKIIGTIPQYILPEGEDDFLPVTGLDYTFMNITDLIDAPIIPSTVEDMFGTFYNCSGLCNAPEIPDNVISLDSTFRGCCSLMLPPIIPDNVNNMDYTFCECSNLTIAPATIPSGITSLSFTFFGCSNIEYAPEIKGTVITNLRCTFYGCTSLKTAPEIPNSVKYMVGTFDGCSSLLVAPTLPDGVEDLSSTFEDCINMTTATTIPSSAKDLFRTFRMCSSLTGDLVVNSDAMTVEFLLEASTNDGCDLKLSGTGANLNVLLNTKSPNSHISLKDN